MAKTVACATLRVVPLRDMILPPASSKVLKEVILDHGGLLARLLSGRGFRRIRISMLYRPGRTPKPLYSLHKPVQSTPLTVRRGEDLRATICVVGSLNEVQELIENPLSGSFDTSYGPIRMDMLEFEVVSEDNLSLGEPTGVLRLEFRTPAILSNRILLCVESERKTPLLHKLLPSPGIVVSYLVKTWNKLMDNPIYVKGSIIDPCIIAKAADIYIAELDFNLKPVTVVVGRDPKGRLRTPRAVVGWILYKITSKRLANIINKTVALAQRMGIGRSRALGYGEVRASWVKPQSAKPTPSPLGVGGQP